MAIADLPSYVERVGVYRDMNAAVLRMTPPDLADLLVSRACAGEGGPRRGRPPLRC
jgi:hypothetical protein